MGSLKAKGDLAELMVAADIVRRGHKVAVPFGEDWDYDLVVERHRKLERVQVKHTRSTGSVVPVRCRSASLTDGRVRRYKYYTRSIIDWIAVWDSRTGACFYIPAEELGEGRSVLHLRLVDALNNQRVGTRRARDYLEF